MGDGEIFNISSGLRTTDYGIFAAVREALDIPPLEPRYAPKRPGEVDHIGLEVSKAHGKLAWEPQVELRQGIKRTAEWFRQRLQKQ
jgi:UDP-glucose 4-epimerase